MRDLFYQTLRALRLGVENPITVEDRVDAIQQEVLWELKKLNIPEHTALGIWDNPGNDYFLREGVRNIIWHTELLYKHFKNSMNYDFKINKKPIIAIKDTSPIEFEGATQIFIFMEDNPNIFAATTSALDQLNLNIMDARIMTSNNFNAVDTYIVLDNNHLPIGSNTCRIDEIKESLDQALSTSEDINRVINIRTPRALKTFDIETVVTMSNSINTNQTTLHITTADRPGLLARMGELLIELKLILHGAKIFTEGEKVSDIFYITGEENQPISNIDFCKIIQDRICQTLDEQVAKQTQI